MRSVRASSAPPEKRRTRESSSELSAAHSQILSASASAPQVGRVVDVGSLNHRRFHFNHRAVIVLCGLSVLVLLQTVPASTRDATDPQRVKTAAEVEAFPRSSVLAQSSTVSFVSGSSPPEVSSDTRAVSDYSWCTSVPVPRYLRLTNDPAGDYVQANELEAWTDAGVNVALGRNCTASSVYRPPEGGDLGCTSVVDGVRVSTFAQGRMGGFFHSSSGAIGEFVEVDLGAEIPLARVTVFNREDAAWMRLAGQKLLLLDGRRRLIASFTLAGVKGGQSFDTSALTCPSKSPTLTASRTPLTRSMTITASLSFGASPSSSVTPTALSTPPRSVSPSPPSDADQLAWAMEARLVARARAEADWALPRLLAPATPATPVRVYHMQEIPTSRAPLLDAYLSPDLTRAVFLFSSHMPRIEFICRGSLADLSISPELGFEHTSSATARPGTAFDGSIATFDNMYWTNVINCHLPSTTTAALAAQRAITLPVAGSTRIGLLVELLSAGTSTEALVHPRALAVDVGPAVQKYDISMWTMTYRKQDDLLAWISYYLALGVEHFYIYDNMSTDSSYLQLAPLVQVGLVTLVIANFTTASQCQKGAGAGETQDLAINHMYTRWGAFSRWIMHFDVDEYIVFPGLPAGEDWIRNQSHGAAALSRPLASLPQLLAVFGVASPDSKPPPFDGLQFLSIFASIPPVPVCAPHPPDIPACEYHYATDTAGYDKTYAKLMVFKAHVPIHKNMHVLSFSSARSVRVQPEAAVIHHLVGCHNGARKRAAPPRHSAACGAIVNFSLTALTDRLAALGLLERLPAGLSADEDQALWRDGAFQHRVVDTKVAFRLILDASLRTARCQTASLVFRNQYIPSASATPFRGGANFSGASSA